MPAARVTSVNEMPRRYLTREDYPAMVRVRVAANQKRAASNERDPPCIAISIVLDRDGTVVRDTAPRSPRFHPLSRGLG